MDTLSVVEKPPDGDRGKGEMMMTGESAMTTGTSAGPLKLRVTVALLAVAVGLALAGAASPAAAAAPVANWQQTDLQIFRGVESLARSQGVASDGRSLFFSWNAGLSRTGLDASYDLLADRRFDAIPDDLLSTNHNHIGDIDVSDGILYAPIEDGPAYLAPWIVLYDADTLAETGKRYLLPHEYLIKGVPWVAIDAPRGVAYTAEWSPTRRLNVHRLSDFSLLRTVALDREVPRIQGAKMFRGNLYLARDNGSEKSIEAIDPETGHVTHLFDRNLGNDYEAEGMAFVRGPTGTVMVATAIYEGVVGGEPMHVEMRSYRINGDMTAPVVRRMRIKPRKTRPGRKVRLRANSSEPVTAALRWRRCRGPRSRPCARSRAVGRPWIRKLKTGPNNLRLAPSYRHPAATVGRERVRLKPGIWRLVLTPTDRADIRGRRATATLRIKKVRPKRQRQRNR